MYRSFIRSKLEAMQNRQELFEGLVAGCAKEEELEHIEAENKVLDMNPDDSAVFLSRLRPDHAGYQA